MNKMKSIPGIIFCLAICIGHFPIFGQTQLPSEEVQVVRDFDARLASAERITVNPALPPIDTTQLSYDFTIQERQLAYDYQPPQIRALGMGRSELDESIGSYLRLGYGVPGSPLADAFTRFRGDKYQAYAEGNHYSVDNRNSVENQIVGRTHLGLGGEYIFHPSLFVGADLQYDYRVNDLYGYDQEIDSFSREDAARRFNIFQANITLGSKEQSSMGLSYAVHLGYQNTSDNILANENQYRLSGNLAWEITESQSFEILGETQFISFSDSISEEQTLNIFSVTPRYRYIGNNFSTTIGLFMGSGNGNSIIFPEIHAQYAVLEDRVIAYLGSSGSLEGQGFSHLTTRNPYFQNTMDSLYAFRQWEIFTGAKGRVQQLEYNLELSYQNFKNRAFFTPNLTDTRLFQAFYESGSVVNLSLNLNYPVKENLTTSLILNQKFFSLDSLDSPIHIPTFTADWRTEYSTFSDRLSLWLEIRFQNGVDFVNAENEYDQLESLFDLSMGADYYIGKNWGLFVHAYNLSNNTRQRWQQYPIIGRNILGGVVLRL